MNVFNRQKEIENRERANLDDILTIPLSDGANWSAEDIQNELDNNGYIVVENSEYMENNLRKLQEASCLNPQEKRLVSLKNLQHVYMMALMA